MAADSNLSGEEFYGCRFCGAIKKIIIYQDYEDDI